MNKINSSDISFVIQGICNYKIVNKNIKKIKQLFPQSEIIISTWKGSKDLDKLSGYDNLIECENIDEVYHAKYMNYTNNFHRMMETSYKGILEAKRKYVFRMRSDLILKSDKFINKYYDFCANEKKPSFFKERILIMDSHVGINLNKSFLPAPFHASDWINFGLKEDLLKLWNGISEIKLMADEKSPNLNFYNENFLYNVIPSEIWLFKQFIDYKNYIYSEPSEKLSNLWSEFIDSNLFIIKFSKIRIVSTKYKIYTSRFLFNKPYIYLKESYYKNKKFHDYMKIKKWIGYFRKQLK